MSAEQDFLGMSDEDILNAPEPTNEPAQAATESETNNEQAAVSEGEVDGGTGAETDESATAAGENTDPATDANVLAEGDEPGAGTAPGESTEGEVKEPGTEAAAKEPEVKDAKDGKAKEEAKPATDTPAIDYKAEYEKLMAPFKANNRDFTVKSVEDAKSLMQMGANYSKKMAALKPHLKLVKSLENAGLLSEDKINYMIDLMANKPGAINKLVKETGVDPMEIDADKAGEYQAGNYGVSEAEMDLDEVMNDLQESPKVGELITFVTKQLDHASKVEINKEPAILRVLDTHMNNGVYGVIMEELQNEITLGRLKNVPMLKAYKDIGDAIQARGGFNHLFQGSTQEKKETPPAGKIVEPPKSSKAEQDKLNEKRRAASSNRPVVAAPSNKTSKDFDPLAMSDADFAKLVL